MATENEVKEWFYKCFRPCFFNKYNTFIDQFNNIGKNYKNGKMQKENNIPIDCGSKYTYDPDIILEDRYNGQISYIIEIQSGGNSAIPMKTIPGAILLADYCVSKQQEKNFKFNMLFIACSKKDINKIKVRIDAAKSYSHWKNLDKIKVCSFDDFRSDPYRIILSI